MSRNFTRRFTAAAAGPLVAAGIFAGSIVLGDQADANAQAVSDGIKCSSLASPGPATQLSPNNLNPLTGAAQVAAVNPTPQAPFFNVNC